MSVAIAISSECDGCIAAHAHAAVRHGATLEEAAEAIGVTILMNGGPATIYGPRAYDAVREFTEALEAILSRDERIEVAGRARDGGEAVELTRKLQPDLILMDVVMPGQNGFQLTRAINRTPEYTGVPQH